MMARAWSPARLVVHDAPVIAAREISDAGCAGLEVDVTVTSDEQLVITPPATVADKEISRTKARQSPYPDLSNDTFVRLSDLYSIAERPPLRLFVDLKCPLGEEAIFAEVITRQAYPPSVTFISLNHRVLKLIGHRTATRTCVVVGGLPVDTAHLASTCGAKGVVLQPRFVSREETRALQEQDLEVITWSAASHERLIEGLAAEPDLAMIDHELFSSLANDEPHRGGR
jgi:glycerophosphoryl diester phosphodiesterase